MLQVCVESGFRCVSHNWVKKYNKGIYSVINDEQAAIEFESPTTGKRATLVKLKPDGGNEVLEDTPNRERLIALSQVIDALESSRNSWFSILNTESLSAAQIMRGQTRPGESN